MTAKRCNGTQASVALPQRSCIVTRAVHDRDKLIRFILSPNNEVVPDIAAKLPGRGAWVVNSRQALARAIERKAFERAWQRSVVVPADLVERVDALLQRHALDALSLANKAGFVIFGYTKVSERIINACDVLLLQAADASTDGRQKLARKYEAICNAIKIEPYIVDIFTVSQISLAVGKPNVVHAAIIRSKATDRFVKSAWRAALFRSDAATGSQYPGAAKYKKSPSEQGE